MNHDKVAKFVVVPSTVKKKNVRSRRNPSHQRGAFLVRYL